MTTWFKRNGIHLAIIGLFILICFVYFLPAIQGKVLNQHDVLQAKGMQKEIMDFREKDGTAPLWTNSMFGGMPAYQIWMRFPKNVTTYVISSLKAIFPSPIDTVLLYLVGAYFLFCVLRAKPWLAAAGAIAFAFSSYNFAIIEAGHANQALAIAFFAPLVASIILTLRGHYLLGGSLTSFFMAMEIRSNHIQMSYYLFIALLILVGIEIYHAFKSKTLPLFAKSVGSLAIAVIIGVAVNTSLLWTTYEYGQESIRGKSNLKTEGDKPSNGLDKDYAYAWSQGVGENITFLVPNAYGGSSVGNLDENSEVAKALIGKGVPVDQAAGIAKQMPTYWGEKSYTAGPFYFGATICFLFILGLLIVRDRIKWWVLGAVVLTLFLSFGKNFPLVSDLFFHYFPLYNKFRAVESILAVTGLLFPILAVLAVRDLSEGKIDSKDLLKNLKIASYITGGVLLIIIVIPSLLLSFKTSTHQSFVDQLTQAFGDQGIANIVANALISDRESLARMDAIRSLVFVAIAAGLVWALIQRKIKVELSFILLSALVLVDLWAVDKRYLNNDKFVEKQDMVFQPREVDQLIARDQTLDYRVLDLTTPDPFSSAYTSYFHKSVGGYHAAKLKRYQEVILKQFNNAINEDVLDMLNTKYVITTGPDGQSQKMVNRASACGNAWFITNVLYVKDADQEMTAINSFDPRKEAIVSEEFKPLINEKKLGTTTNASISLTSYHPDHLTYEYTAPNDVIAVFAEIWYTKGWNAYVDGTKIPYFRANYILRGAQLPGGNHKLEFKFEPASYYTGENISLAASILLIVGLGAVGFKEGRKKKEVA
ncbi:YfhO family protein [Desertivirga brevis]|uniref:YfhO family protein n=1 Tax=Desertivirga brevis TaxID=2810310 RepID=UPI001A97093E|nr:YfhO family protein [Pedobacter sp. SYSU D00873]